MYKSDKYIFKWQDLGDIQLGRPNLGPNTLVAVYRLMEYTFRSVMNNELGVEKTNEIFYSAGKLAGIEFCKNTLNTEIDASTFICDLQKQMVDYKMGILRIEEADFENNSFIVTVSEDLDCSGLPITDETVCSYDEGFLSGVFENYYGHSFKVVEIDCWSTGERTCRFNINKQE